MYRKKSSILLLTVVLITSLLIVYPTLSSTNQITIQEIQRDRTEKGGSSYADETVTTTGVVTATGDSGYYLQDGSGPWSGIFVYIDRSPKVSPGDKLRVTGKVTEYYSLTEIKPSSTEKLGETAVPDPLMLKTSKVGQEKYESTLVKVEGLKVASTPNEHGVWTVNDGSGKVAIDGSNTGAEYQPDSKGTAINYISGPVTFSYGQFRIQPKEVSKSGKTAKTPTVSVHEIQSNRTEKGASKYAGKSVVTTGTAVVTDDNGFYLQDGKGPWNGIWVYTGGSPGVSPGDEVRVKGPIDEYYKMTEFNQPESVEVIGSGTVPEPVVLEAGEVRQEKYEGVLVKLKTIKVANPAAGNGNWYVKDETGKLLISGSHLGDAATPTEKGQRVTLIKGPVDFSYGEFRVRPQEIEGLKVSFPKRRKLGEPMQYPDLPKIDKFRVFLLKGEVEFAGTDTGVKLSFTTGEVEEVTVKYGKYVPESGPQLPEFSYTKKVSYESPKEGHAIGLNLEELNLKKPTTIQYRLFADGIPYGGRFRVEPGADYEIVPYIEEGPFVDLVEKNSAFISWETNVATVGQVKVGDKTFGSDEAKEEHSVKLTGLSPETETTYSVEVSPPNSDYWMSTKKFSFETESADDEFKFAFLGDSRGGYEGSEHTEGLVNYANSANYDTMTKLMESIYDHGMDFTVFAGDLVKGYTNNVEGFHNQLEAWKDTIEPVGAYVPVYEGIGNHESLYTAYDDGSTYGIQFDKTGENSTEAVFAEEFVNPTAKPESGYPMISPKPEGPNAPTYKENAYYFDYDNSRILVINTNYWISTSPEKYGGNLEGFVLENQMNWIEKVVEDAKQDPDIDHVFPVMHEPPFPNSAHIDDTMWYNGQKRYVLEMRDEMLKIFGESGIVPAILASDEHNYQRLLVTTHTPVYTNMTSADYGSSFYEIVSGGAGAPKYERMYAPWGSYLKKFKSAAHYVGVHVDGEEVKVKAIDKSGKVIDEKVISRKEKVAEKEVKFATFNIENLTTEQVQKKGDTQASAAAEIIQRVNPDVLALNEIANNIQQGKMTGTSNAEAFVENYLKKPQKEGLPSLDYEYIYVAKSNTGIPSGMDIDNNGKVVTEPGSRLYGNDCYGWGEYPGQYAMALLSKYPIRRDQVRTFRKFLWKDMPNNKMPVGSEHGGQFLTEEEAEKFRLSSKSHWDVPVNIDGTTVHILMAHPTPPVFDAEANLNGRRNHDEVRLLTDYVKGKDYIYDDSGQKGGLPEAAKFVLMGDMNASPGGADNFQAAKLLINNPEMNTSTFPMSQGGIDIGAAARFNTMSDLRVDYVLPSEEITIKGSGVFWPGLGPDSLLLKEVVKNASDHRMVWVETAINGTKH